MPKPKHSSKIWIGIDNGVSGSIGWVGANTGFIKTPTFSCLNYQKSKAQTIARVSTSRLEDFLLDLAAKARVIVLLERPMVNPKRFAATASALRALEATLIVIEKLELSFTYCDSKAWQKMLLPPVKGAANLKRASQQIGSQLFPKLKSQIVEHGDADGLLIAEWAKRSNL